MTKFSEEDIAQEQRLFLNVVATFEQYETYAVSVSASINNQHLLRVACPRSKLSANNRRRKDFYTLPLADQKLLDELGYKTKLAEVDKAIIANAQFVRQMVAEPQIFSELDTDEEDEGDDVDGDGGMLQTSCPCEPRSNSMKIKLTLIVTLMTIAMTTLKDTPMTIRMRTLIRIPPQIMAIRTHMSIHPQRRVTGLQTSTWTSLEALSSNSSETGAKRFVLCFTLT